MARDVLTTLQLGSSADDRFARSNGVSGGLVLEAIPISRGAVVTSPVTGLTLMIWRAPYACTITNVRGHFKGGTSVVYNARRNQSSNFLSSNKTMSTADSWDDGGTVQNTAIAAGDDIEIMIVTVTGAVTECIIQVDLTRP